VVVVVAAVTALAIWAIAELELGIDLQTPALAGIPEPTPIGARDVNMVSGFLSLAGWVLLAVLERLTRSARQLWAAIGLVALVLSLATPLSGTGITAANRIVHMLIHIGVGSVLIIALYVTSPSSRARRS
jgi:Family of unknown function (DUF6069)